VEGGGESSGGFFFLFPPPPSPQLNKQQPFFFQKELKYLNFPFPFPLLSFAVARRRQGDKMDSYPHILPSSPRGERLMGKVWRCFLLSFSSPLFLFPLICQQPRRRRRSVAIDPSSPPLSFHMGWLMKALK